jgi:hypothetical protein
MKKYISKQFLIVSMIYLIRIDLFLIIMANHFHGHLKCIIIYVNMHLIKIHFKLYLDKLKKLLKLMSQIYVALL